MLCLGLCVNQLLVGSLQCMYYRNSIFSFVLPMEIWRNYLPSKVEYFSKSEEIFPHCQNNRKLQIHFENYLSMYLDSIFTLSWLLHLEVNWWTRKKRLQRIYKIKAWFKSKPISKKNDFQFLLTFITYCIACVTKSPFFWWPTRYGSKTRNCSGRDIFVWYFFNDLFWRARTDFAVLDFWDLKVVFVNIFDLFILI